MYSFAARSAENFGKTHALNLNPITPKTLKRIRPNFNRWPKLKLPIHPQNFVKIAQRIRPCGAFIFWNCVNFQFWGPHRHPSTDGDEIWCRPQWTPRQISSPSVQHVSPAGPETSKSPQVTEIPALRFASLVLPAMNCCRPWGNRPHACSLVSRYKYTLYYLHVTEFIHASAYWYSLRIVVIIYTELSKTLTQQYTFRNQNGVVRMARR